MSIYYSQPKKPVQSPEEKERLRKAAEALFMEIDEEFGKKKKPAISGLAVRTPKAKSLSPGVVQVSEGQEANRISMLMGETSPWRPTARVAHLVVQICKCCKGEQEFLGNVLIRHTHKLRGHTWDCSIPVDASHSLLPQVVNTTTTYVEECPACIRFDMHMQPVDIDNFQLSLFS